MPKFDVQGRFRQHMNDQNRFRGTLLYVFANWPVYLGLYGGLVLMLVIIGVSAQQGWLGLIPLAAAVFTVLAYFLAASLWATHRLYDPDGIRPHHVLFDLGGLRATDTLAFIDVGYRRRALSLSRRLTTGKIVIVDVYNPQLAPGASLARQRKRLLHPPADPRLSWRDGSISLLPLPDKSISVVMLCEVTSAFWQRGDQLSLLREAHRVLVPNGRLLLAERTRTRTGWLTLGPAALGLKTGAYWEQLLQEAGFVIRRIEDEQGLIACFRADKPTPSEARQLALELAFEA